MQACAHALLAVSLAGAVARADKSAAVAVWVLFVVGLDECALIEPDAQTKKVALHSEAGEGRQTGAERWGVGRWRCIARHGKGGSCLLYTSPSPRD